VRQEGYQQHCWQLQQGLCIQLLPLLLLLLLKLKQG
jgi:hypothetical protein